MKGKRVMKRFLLASVLLSASSAYAAGFHYCTGKVEELVTRASSEDTQVRIAGMSGWAQLGYGGQTFSTMHQRQFSTLLAVINSGK